MAVSIAADETDRLATQLGGQCMVARIMGDIGFAGELATVTELVAIHFPERLEEFISQGAGLRDTDF